MKYTAITIILFTSIIFLGCQPPATNSNLANVNSNSTASNAKWDAYVEQFITDDFTSNPPLGVSQGRHEFDGKFPDWSEDGLTKELARLRSEREKVAAFKYDELDERQRFEHDYIMAQIDKDLFWRETADQPHTNPYFYSDAIDPDVYVSREYAPLDVRMKAYTAYAKNVP